MIFIAHTEAELKPVAEYLISLMPQRTVFTLTGQLGAGKTALVKEICRQLGVEEAVSSPTFALVNEYAGDKGPIYHFDFYRLKSAREAWDIGFEEYLDSGYPCFIEWPGIVDELLPQDAVAVSITVEGEKRVIEVVV